MANRIVLVRLIADLERNLKPLHLIICIFLQGLVWLYFHDRITLYITLKVFKQLVVFSSLICKILLQIPLILEAERNPIQLTLSAGWNFWNFHFIDPVRR